ncbi:hypothetical protein Xmlh_08375 [Xanthomonas axonopodis pv. melhusii]|uniref:Uncharacterized protein n=1 Tax=Xanthomonas axonopodis pv. melhusii TaxID=487834 RepID=A0A1T1P767_9XANT|nr:hypothetical protein [Xanthomonas axonopodis]OOW71479.1 hypothetical protein Xmlh_08375 [Xanthomonas axonopodis pv. melhusii]
MNEHSGNSGQLQQRSAAAGLNESFGDSEQLARPDAGSGGDALDVPFAWTWMSQAGERHVTTYERHARDVAGADGCVVHAITPQMLTARQPVGMEPVAFVPVHPNFGPMWSDTFPAGHCNDGRSRASERRPLYFAPPAQADRMAIKMLVAAGFVSEDKANESLRIAHGFGGDLGQSAPAAAGVPGECVYAMNTGEQDEQGHELYVLTDKPIPLSDYELLYRSTPAHPAPAAVQTDFVEVATCDQESADGFQWLPGFTRSSFPTGAGVFIGQPPAAAAVPVDGLRESQILAKDHDGMRVSYSGLLRQARGALTRGSADPALAEMLRQLEKHMEELGKRWYAGDRLVVDELLQLYCIETNARRALLATHPQPTAACVNIDAMRYLYLRAQPVEGGPWGTPRIAIPSSERAGEFANGDDADAAIDAAIAAQQAKPEVQ